ncbi:MAG: GapR family DNA-binding domain-containing protein [Rhizobiaceae bacterium]
MSEISETISAGQLRAFIERIERVEEEIRDLNADKSDIYKELRGCGFDVKAVRQCVAARKLDSAEREERNAIFDLYWEALTGSSRVHVHEASQSYAEAKGREKSVDYGTLRLHDEQLAAQHARERELTQTQEQPEEDEPCDCADRAKPGQYYHCPKCDTEWFPEEDNSPTPSSAPRMAADDVPPKPQDTSSAPFQSAAVSPSGAVKAPEADSLPASGASFDNPRCQNPDGCTFAHSRNSCFDCTMAWAKRPKAEQVLLWQEAMEAAESEVA